MKLAEALILRADIQKRIEQLKQRILRNAKVQEGDKPAEQPEELIEEFEQLSEELTQLVQRINRTNAATKIEPKVTLTDALAIRDALKLSHGMYTSLAQEATVTQSRFTKSDIQKRADDLAKEHRELDTQIQEANWRTELLN
jgi:hypothetical protein